MKERPIIFSGSMVRAILAGEKSQTRRVVKFRDREGKRVLLPLRRGGQGHGYLIDTPGDVSDGSPLGGYLDMVNRCRETGWKPWCPYGWKGDHLWVRESWQDVHPLQVADGRYSQEGRAGIPGPPPVDYQTIYRADGPYPRIHFDNQDGTRDGWPYRSVCPGEGCKLRHIHPEESYVGWTPSIHMPRWACRLVLEITDVRVQRLQDITREDIIAEGVRIPACETSGNPLIDISTPNGPGAFLTREQFIDPDALLRAHWAALWCAINGRASWDANPWVWALSFRRIDA